MNNSKVKVISKFNENGETLKEKIYKILQNEALIKSVVLQSKIKQQGENDFTKQTKRGCENEW